MQAIPAGTAFAHIRNCGVALAALGALCAAPAAAQDIGALFAKSDPQSTERVEHGAWAELLRRHVRTGSDGVTRVDYRNFSEKDRPALRGYLDALQQVAVTRLNRAEQMAYWINLYNAATIDVVIAHYPVVSIRDIAISPGFLAKGPWGKKLVRVEGTELSLDDIEHVILRPLWRDARVHYALNCGSIGCPNLASVPYTGANLDRMLDALARDYINHPRGVSFREGRLVVSNIYFWYARDFGRDEAGIIDHLRRFAAPELEQKLASATGLGGYEYDWRLNDAGE
jgi:hypothetical protein